MASALFLDLCDRDACIYVHPTSPLFQYLFDFMDYMKAILHTIVSRVNGNLLPLRNVAVAGLLVGLIGLGSCTKKDADELLNILNLAYGVGYANQDNASTVPVLPSVYGYNSTLPAAYDLTPFLPPIGNQGRSNSCVSWSVGYYQRSAVMANRQQRSPQQAANQASAHDLHTIVKELVRDNLSCSDGTYFEKAYAGLINHGAVSNSLVPFSMGNGNCFNVRSGVNRDAFKLVGYRRVELNNRSVSDAINVVKTALVREASPLTFGMNVSRSFENYSGGVFRQHQNPYQGGGHAMTVVGYNDANQTFKVANSWGTSWGDNGFIYVDYNFFVSSFVTNKVLFAGVTGETPVNPNPNPGPVNRPNVSAEYLSDVRTSGRQRRATVNITATNYSATTVKAQFYLVEVFGENVEEYLPFNASVQGNQGLLYTVGTNVSGYYNPVLILDPDEELAESDEEDNLAWYEDFLYFQNGVALRAPAPDQVMPTWNRYTKRELLQLIKAKDPRIHHVATLHVQVDKN